MVLSPAAADILEGLGAGGLVVGKTRNIRLFPGAVCVGSHIRPNLEIVASLRPDLIIASSERFFSRELAKKVGADFYVYDPRTLEGILGHIKRLGALLGRRKRAEALVSRLKALMEGVKPLRRRPRVLYEVMEMPYTLAGRGNIVVDIIERAGGVYPISSPRKFVRLSCERVRLLHPDVYIYQVGPMNKKPSPPDKRPCLSGLRMRVVRVSELSFARANTESFRNLLFLNRIFSEWAHEKR